MFGMQIASGGALVWRERLGYLSVLFKSQWTHILRSSPVDSKSKYLFEGGMSYDPGRQWTELMVG